VTKIRPILDQVTQRRRQLLQDVEARRKRFVTSATSRFAQLDAIQVCRYPSDREPDQEPEIELPITASAEMRSYRTSYRTKDRNADYTFLFEEQTDGSWRAYIERQPSYRGRATDAHSTHRLSDGNRQYVCWTSSLDSLEDAKQVAALWADKTQDYIRTGATF
jgi:hypothetical protein